MAQQLSNIDEDELEAVERGNQHFGRLYEKVYECAERCASTYIGQYVIERADRVLKVIENTAKWSLPLGGDDQADAQIQLERPLPWLPFIGMIVLLRMIRIWLSVAALLIGNSPVAVNDMIYFIQTRRRKLRAVRINGLRKIHQREQEKALKSGNGQGIIVKLRSLISIVICRPGQHQDTTQHVVIHRTKLQRGQACESVSLEASDEPKTMVDQNRDLFRRLHNEECVDQNLTVDEMLNKYCDEDSADDSDFIPNFDAESQGSSSTSPGTPSSSSDENLEDKDEQNDSESEKIQNENTDGQTNDTNGDIVSQHKNKSKLDTSVEIKENGGHHHPMPRPMVEIKEEPLSDVNSESGDPAQQRDSPEKNETKHGADQSAKKDQQNLLSSAPLAEIIASASAAAESTGLSKMAEEDQLKSTPGHQSAAMCQPTRDAGSPDFNACFEFKPISILKNSNLPTSTEGDKIDACSTPKENAMYVKTTTPSSGDICISKQLPSPKDIKIQSPQNQSIKQPKNRQHHQSKNRVKNRR